MAYGPQPADLSTALQFLTARQPAGVQMAFAGNGLPTHEAAGGMAVQPLPNGGLQFGGKAVPPAGLPAATGQAYPGMDANWQGVGAAQRQFDTPVVQPQSPLQNIVATLGPASLGPEKQEATRGALAQLSDFISGKAASQPNGLGGLVSDAAQGAYNPERTDGLSTVVNGFAKGSKARAEREERKRAQVLAEEDREWKKEDRQMSREDRELEREEYRRKVADEEDDELYGRGRDSKQDARQAEADERAKREGSYQEIITELNIKTKLKELELLEDQGVDPKLANDIATSRASVRRSIMDKYEKKDEFGETVPLTPQELTAIETEVDRELPMRRAPEPAGGGSSEAPRQSDFGGFVKGSGKSEADPVTLTGTAEQKRKAFQALPSGTWVSNPGGSVPLGQKP
jgi:hypothetical protein